MSRIVCVFLIASLCLAQTGSPVLERRVWTATLATMAASAAVDIHSSWGRYELNPALASQGSVFGGRHAALSAGITVAWIAGEVLVLRLLSRLYRDDLERRVGQERRALQVFGLLNAAGTIAHATVGAYNYGHPKAR